MSSFKPSDATLRLRTDSTALHEEAKTNEDQTKGNNPILIVDDNPFNILALNTLLKKIYGISGDSAYDGNEGVKAATENDYKLIFMDCNMPNKDGFGATHDIRNLPYPKG